VLGRGTGTRRSWRDLPGWLLPLGGLLVVGLVWSFFVGFVQAKTGFRIDFFYVLLAVALWRAPLNARERDWLVTILMVNGVITALWGIAQQVVGSTRLYELGYAYNTVIRNSHGHLRSFSTFEQPFSFAFFLMVVVLVATPVVLSDPRRLRNRVFLFCVPLLGLGMILALVRGAWLGLAIGWLYLGLRRHRILLLALPVGAAAVVALLLLPGTFGSSALSSSSLHQRFDSWHRNLDHVLRHPQGTGIGSSGAAAAKTAYLTGARHHTFQPDNYYFKEIYELGIPGLLLFVWLLFAAFWNADRKSVRIRGPDGALALGVAASVVGVAAASLVSTYLEISPMDLMFWLLLSVVAFSCTTSPSTA
jgi:putative inorganic carbon (HCO3(-)) transporter